MAAARCPWLVLTTMLLVLLASSGAGAAEELTHLSFYIHEVPSGAPNATIATVAGLNVTGSTFGDLRVSDDALREGPDPSSTLIGRAPGLLVAASLDNSGSVTINEFVFSNYGKYSGSTLATLGHLTLPIPTERSIVGGTGVFRFARGYFTTQVISSTSDLGVARFDVYFTTELCSLTHASS